VPSPTTAPDAGPDRLPDGSPDLEREAPDPRPTYRVRYNRAGRTGQQRAADVETRDVPGSLDRIPGELPPGAYILSVEDLATGKGVHWTRWPANYRPGFGG
jgi:hypothetical protein